MAALFAWIKKVIKPDRRKSRLHTEAGEALSPRYWHTVPANVVTGLLERRGLKKPPRRPWFPAPAILWLEETLAPNWNVIECGSGFSTVWLSRRTGHLISLEDNPKWHAETAAHLDGAAVANCSLTLIGSGMFAVALSELGEETADLVIVDHAEQESGERMASVAAARKVVCEGGYVLLDDSDRTEYKEADMILASWKKTNFVGLKHSAPAVATACVVYQRPAVIVGS